MRDISLHIQIIEGLGGDHAVARLLGIKAPSVNGWKRRGIPKGRLLELACDIERNGIASRKTLFPDDWTRYWPELADPPKTDTTLPT